MMRKDFASLIAIISIFSLVACTDGKPEFFSLSSVMGPTFSGESAKEYSIAEMTDSLLISGECPPQMSQIEISLDQGNTWELPGDDSSDLDCLDQKFSFEIKDGTTT